MGERGHRRGWILLALALAIVAGIAVWPRSGSRARTEADAADVARADREGSRGGVAARQATTAAVGRVQADVVDEDGTPVDGGTVVLRCLDQDAIVRAIEGGSIALGEDGRLDGPGCRGTVCAELRHAAFVAADAWVLAPGQTSILRARTLDAVRGRVVDATGEPVANASIVVGPEPGQDDPTAVPPVTTTVTSTDADGAFALPRIERAPCDPCREAEGTCDDAPLPVLESILVSARAAGHGPGQVVAEIGRDDEIEIALSAAGDPLRGRLTDRDGRPFARAFVLARSIDRPAEQHRADVDAGDGRFTVADLGDGAYRVRAIQDGLELAAVQPAAAGDDVELVADAVQCDVAIEIVDEGAAPIARARVDGGPFAHASTDAQGRVRAHAVATGTYMLRVRAPGDRARAHTIAIDECDAASAGSPGVAPRIARIRLPTTRKR